MRVKKIQLSNFMRHDDSTFEFPPSGIVVVTGPNGSGKSTFLEAIPYGMWGKTLRGTPPYRSKQETTAELAALARRQLELVDLARPDECCVN